MKVVYHKEFFDDIRYRRVGWWNNTVFSWWSCGRCFEIIIGPFQLFIDNHKD